VAFDLGADNEHARADVEEKEEEDREEDKSFQSTVDFHHEGELRNHVLLALQQLEHFCQPSHSDQLVKLSDLCKPEKLVKVASREHVIKGHNREQVNEEPASDVRHRDFFAIRDLLHRLFVLESREEAKKDVEKEKAIDCEVRYDPSRRVLLSEGKSVRHNQ